MPSLSQGRTPGGADSPAGLGWGRPGLGSPVPAAAAAALLRRGSAFVAAAAAAAAAVRGGGRHVTAEHSLPAPLPLSLRSSSRGRGSGGGPHPATRRSSQQVPGAGALCPRLTGGETENRRGQGLTQGYTAGLWQGPGEHPAMRPMLQGERDNFWGKWGTRPSPPPPWARRVCRGGRK